METRDPYEYEVVSTPLVGWPTVNITFDETVIRTGTMPVDLAKELVTTLNQAFAVGYMEGKAGL